MDINYKRILDEKLYLKETECIPPDLRENINALEHVLRFQFKEYPAGVINDNTKVHTLKCVHIAKSFGLDVKYKDLLRTLWIHDIPELETNDITVIERERAISALKAFEKRELRAAQNLLNKTDQELLKAFNEAGSILKGKQATKVPFSFLFAAIIDNTEGSMTFTYFVTKWIKTNDYKKELLPPVDSLLYCFTSSSKFKKAIKQGLPPKAGEELVEFIDSVLNEIKLFWKDVPQEKVPAVVKDAIKDYESKN